MTSQTTVGFAGTLTGTTGGDALIHRTPGANPAVGNAEEVLKSACDKRPTLICTVGLPYAGLNTHARKLGVPIVSPDAIRLALHGQRFIQQAEDTVWTHARLMVRALFLAGHPTVVLSACNTTTRRRAQWIDPQEWKVEFHHIITPYDTCIERAQQARDFEMLPVIQRKYENWEPFRSVEDAWPVRLFERGVEVSSYPTSWGRRPQNPSYLEYQKEEGRLEHGPGA